MDETYQWCGGWGIREPWNVVHHLLDIRLCTIDTCGSCADSEHVAYVTDKGQSENSRTASLNFCNDGEHDSIGFIEKDEHFIAVEVLEATTSRRGCSRRDIVYGTIELGSHAVVNGRLVDVVCNIVFKGIQSGTSEESGA